MAGRCEFQKLNQYFVNMFHAKTKLSRANINYFLKVIANSMSSSNICGEAEIINTIENN